jgi:hypothetical protein
MLKLIEKFWCSLEGLFRARRCRNGTCKLWDECDEPGHVHQRWEIIRSGRHSKCKPLQPEDYFVVKTASVLNSFVHIGCGIKLNSDILFLIGLQLQWHLKHVTYFVRFQVFTAVTMKNVVFWDIKPSSYLIGSTLRLRHTGQAVNAM